MKPPGKHPHKRLSSVQIKALTEPGRYADGDGLYLVVDPSGAKRWVLRVMIAGKRTDIGLGGTSTVTLKDAREATLAMHTTIRSGGDPLAERRARRRVVPTFSEAVQTVHASLAPTWKNDKHSSQWINTLTTYAVPHLGQLKIDTIGTPDVLAVLNPIWLSKPETARRVKQRMHAVFDWAKAAGHRTGENPVDGVDRGLPRQNDQDKHHSALPYEQVNQFVSALKASPSGAASKLGFEFLILTAARTGEVIEAKWSEIDLARSCWTIPGMRMKAGKEHRVPLSPRCIEILREAERLKAKGDYVFPGRKAGQPLSNMAFTQIIRRLDEPVTAHGFRSTFRVWAAEQTHFPNEVCEQALAHSIVNKVEAAYRRTDLFEKRSELMLSWASFVGQSNEQTQAAGHPSSIKVGEVTMESDSP